jgi:SAM-dependent methyltransferase
MISDNQLKELQVYRDMERGLSLESRPDFGPLVVAGGNEVLPIHRWFRFKEAYSAGLLPALLAAYPPNKKHCTLLDPYCGVGTTLLAAQSLQNYKLRVVGIEYNPFIRFVASTKTQWQLVNPSALELIASRVVDVAPVRLELVPELSGLTTGRCMSTFIARRLLAIRDAIMSDGNSATHQALLLGLAAAIEPLSHTRKDGRALRLVERPRQVVSQILLAKWQSMAGDIRQMQKERQNLNGVSVIAGDGRRPLRYGIQPESIDLIVTSPPYFNNIDYSEVYKLELWLLGFIKDGNAFLQLRKGTFRSHPTSYLTESEEGFLKCLSTGSLQRAFSPILSKLDTNDEKWRRKLFIAYFSDIASALQQYLVVLKTGGRALVTVGNSLHGGKYAPYVVATDLLIAELARSQGFIVEEISVARPLKRRLSGNHFLRESVIAIRKTDG